MTNCLLISSNLKKSLNYNVGLLFKKITVENDEHKKTKPFKKWALQHVGRLVVQRNV